MNKITQKQERALAALLTAPTAKAAAVLAGIDERTLRRYRKDPEFLTEYRKRCSAMLEEATDKAKSALPPAVERLRLIVEDDAQPPQQQIAAARTLIEYGLRLMEATDIETRLRELEERSANH